MPIAERPVQSPLSAEVQAIVRCLSCDSRLDSDQFGRFSDVWRRYTLKMKLETLHGMLKVAVPLSYNLQQGLKRLPLAGHRAANLVYHLFPITARKITKRECSTPSIGIAKHQSKHTYEQVFRWYEFMGMEDMRVGEIPVAGRGRKPLRAS